MSTILATEGLTAFMKCLSSTQQDRFVRVMGRLEASGSDAKIEELEAALRCIKSKLEEVDTIRRKLSANKEDLRGVLADLDTMINGEKAVPPDLILFRLLLLQLDAELEEGIAITRPVELLAEKVRLRKEIVRQRLLGKLAVMVSRAARGKLRDGRT